MNITVALDAFTQNSTTATLTISTTSETFNQNGGILDNRDVFDLSLATFNFNGGTLVGNPPIITSGKLNIGPGSTGAGEIIIRGNGTLSGILNPQTAAGIYLSQAAG